jgi:hypothetical protein
MDHDLRTQPSLCPHCGELLTGAANSEAGADNPPAPGDWSLCIYCGEVGMFTVAKTASGALLVRKLTPSEQKLAASDRGVARAQAAWRMMHGAGR